MTGAQIAFYLFTVSGSVGLLVVDVGAVTGRSGVVVACNLTRMDRWSELMVVCVCHSDEVMREVHANYIPGKLESAFPGSLVCEYVFRTATLEMLIESVSWVSPVSVVPECQSEW